MLINILSIPLLRGQLFQQLCGVIAVTDMIQSFSWFIGRKWEESYSTCAMQEYFLQAGALYKAFCTLLICAISTYIVRTLKLPTTSFLFPFFSISFILPSILLCISIYFKSARIYCGLNDESEYEEGNLDNRLSVYAFGLAFLIPIYLCSIFDSILFGYLTYKLVIAKNDKHNSMIFDNSYLMKAVERIKIFPLCFSLGWSLELFIYIYSAIYSSPPLYVQLLASLGISSVGISMALFYFYHQKVLLNVKTLVIEGQFEVCDNPILSYQTSKNTDTSYMQSTQMTRESSMIERMRDSSITEQRMSDISSLGPYGPPNISLDKSNPYDASICF